jgi:Polyketide cyclase / dehydrase and lipid transport
MLTKILMVVALLIIVLIIVIALQAPSYTVTRSANIAASPPAVFAHVNDFHNWEAWSPWAKLDPGMKQSFQGAPAGAGAIYSWVGNKQVGEGRMTITESRPSDLVRIKLEFIKPFASIADTEFTFKPEGNQTAVTWTMSGQKNFMSKAFGLFMNMDKMIGRDFEKGLAQMKSVVEGKPK